MSTAIIIPGSKDSKEIDPTTNLTIVIVGPKGIGKSWLSATAEPPVFNFDFDNRANALANKPNLSVKTYTDLNPAAKTEAWLNFENDISLFEQMKREKKPIPRSYVFDSLQFGCKAAMDYVLMMNSGMRRQVTVGGKTVYAPKSWDAYGLEFPLVRDALSRLMCLGNLIINVHESPEEAPDSTVESPKYTGKIGIYPVRMKKLLPLFNDYWRIITINGERKVQTSCNQFEFQGSTSLLLDPLEEPNIEAMLKKHRSRSVATVINAIAVVK